MTPTFPAARSPKIENFVGFELAQKGALFGQDQATVIGKAEVCGTLRILLQSPPVGLVGSQVVEVDQTLGDIVGPLVRIQ